MSKFLLICSLLKSSDHVWFLTVCLILYLAEDRHGSWTAQLQPLFSAVQCGQVVTQTHTFPIKWIKWMYLDCLCLILVLLFAFTRLAFSCIWEINHKAEILKTRFTKSVINSKVSCQHTGTVSILFFKFIPFFLMLPFCVRFYAIILFLCKVYYYYYWWFSLFWSRHLWHMLRPRWGLMTPTRMTI